MNYDYIKYSNLLTCFTSIYHNSYICINIAWVEMCDKRNHIINFDETKFTRSTRRTRHGHTANNEQNNKVHNILT